MKTMELTDLVEEIDNEEFFEDMEETTITVDGIAVAVMVSLEKYDEMREKLKKHI